MKLEVSVKVDDIFLFTKAQKAALRQRLSGEEQWLTIAPETFEADFFQCVLNSSSPKKQIDYDFAISNKKSFYVFSLTSRQKL